MFLTGTPLGAVWLTGVAAAALTAAAILVPTDNSVARVRLLLGVAGIAGGVAFAGAGAGGLAHHDTLVGVAIIALGVALAGAGAAGLADHDSLVGVVAIALGVAGVGVGAAKLSGEVLGQRLHMWRTWAVAGRPDEPAGTAGDPGAAEGAGPPPV